jgi:hypothetical protein
MLKIEVSHCESRVIVIESARRRFQTFLFVNWILVLTAFECVPLLALLAQILRHFVSNGHGFQFLSLDGSG